MKTQSSPLPEFLDSCGGAESLKTMFGKMIVLEARHDYRTRSVEYVAESDLFDPVEDCCIAPQYEIQFSRFGGSLVVSARRCDPAPVLNFTFKQKIARLKMAVKAFFK